MKLSLARWEFAGSSEGFWLIRQIPGAYVFSVEGGWTFDNNPQLLQGFGMAAERLWGAFWEPAKLPERKVFKTRAEALSYLEMAFSDPEEPTLPEVL